MSLSTRILRQSAAELLACSILQLFPKAKLIKGGNTEFGFYYDFCLFPPLDHRAIPLIEEKMRALTKENLTIRPLEMMRENAVEFFIHQNQEIKAELVSQSLDNIVPLIQIEDFCDYCPPPYATETVEIGAFKIMEIVPVPLPYLYRNKKRPVMRIRGMVAQDSPSLKKSLKVAEAAKKRDHQLLGQEMHLFSQNDERDLGGWIWHPKGTILRETLIDWWRQECRQLQFKFVISPTLIKTAFMEKAGVPFARSLPFFLLDEEKYTWKNALTPFHLLFFHSSPRLDRELPFRLAECADVLTNDNTRPLERLFHTHTVYTDIAHLFCVDSQVIPELISSLQFIDRIIKILGFEYQWYLGEKRKKKGRETDQLNNWDRGFKWIVQALDACGFKYQIDPFEEAPLGPFVEARLVDSLGREWQGPQISLDLDSPERWGLSYQDSEGERQTPILIALTLFRSLERFIAILIEHYGGSFPLWLAPEQVRVMPVTARNRPHAEKIRSLIEQSGFKVSLDDHSDRLGQKIHKAESERIPYLIIVGDQEEQVNTITVRSLHDKDTRASFDLNAFLAKMLEEILTKAPLSAQRNYKIGR